MLKQTPLAESPWWTVQRGDDPIVATAIHDGHHLRRDVAESMALSEADRLREEDPFTGQAVTAVPTHVVVHRSRYEIDLNRDLDNAVYLTPEQSWGLACWRNPPDAIAIEHSRRMHRAYYAMLGGLLDDIVATHGRFVLLDVHMPGLTGPQVQARLRAAGLDLPVVFITASDDADVERRALEAGGLQVLLKPFTNETLLDALRLALSPRPRHDG